MKRATTFAAVLTVLIAACGGAADETAAPSADAVGETSQTISPSPTSLAEESAAPDGSGGTLPTGDEQALEVELVDPNSGEKSDNPVPPPAAEDGTTPPPPVVDHSNPQAAIAISDLVVRLGIDVSAVEVVSVDEVTWPDGSIGCPLPGMRYTQALVNGTRVILQAGGLHYQYNSGGGREPFYCADPSDPVPGDGDYGDI